MTDEKKTDNEPTDLTDEELGGVEGAIGDFRATAEARGVPLLLDGVVTPVLATEPIDRAGKRVSTPTKTFKPK